MQISESPHHLMQNLLDEFKKEMVDFLNLEESNLPIQVQQDINNQLIKTNVVGEDGEQRIDNSSDLYKILRIIWSHWDDFKDRIFKINESNGYGKTYRSYVSIIMQARNEWAHQSALTYEDVLFYGFTLQRFSKNNRSEFDSSIIDQIVEVCIQKITHVDSPVGYQGSSDQCDDVFSQAALPKTEENTIDELASMPEFDCTPELAEPFVMEENSINEEEDEQQGELLEDYEDNFTDLFDNTQYDLVKLINLFKEYAEHGVYEIFAAKIENSNEISVTPGRYQDTLCFTDKQITFAYGYRKLVLIRDYIVQIAMFAIFNCLDESMAGQFKGYGVICIPSKEDAQISLGRTRARILCARMYEIDEWLIEYES